MKTLLLTLLALLILAGCQEPASEVEFRDVSAQEAADLIASQSDLVILDIRTPEEFAAGHIKDAMLINFHGESFTAEIAKLDRTKPYLMHCASGGRSGQAMKTFKELDFTNIYHLNVGFRGWKSSGQSVVTQ